MSSLRKLVVLAFGVVASEVHFTSELWRLLFLYARDNNNAVLRLGLKEDMRTCRTLGL